MGRIEPVRRRQFRKFPQIKTIFFVTSFRKLGTKTKNQLLESLLGVIFHSLWKKLMSKAKQLPNFHSVYCKLLKIFQRPAKMSFESPPALYQCCFLHFKYVSSLIQKAVNN